MIYLDNGATSFCKPPQVSRSMLRAMETCANPGRGGYKAAINAGEAVYRCREEAGKLFDCHPGQVVFTSNCTHGLNIALRSLVKPGDKVLISGFEHNAVTRTLALLRGEGLIAGRKLFDQADTLEAFEHCLRQRPAAAVFTHVSNVFGYILPVEEMAALCRSKGIPFVVDAAQSAGALPVSLTKLGADFIAMPGHKGLLGPQGTGILLCSGGVKPFMAGGTGSESRQQEMPEFLPDRLEPGTLNVPGICGLAAGMSYVRSVGVERIGRREAEAAKACALMLRGRGYRVFTGSNQAGTVSFVPDMDCEEMAEQLGRRGVAVRAGLHCAPLAHESAGTLESGTVRVSFGHDASLHQVAQLNRILGEIEAQKVKKL
jgi:selenocysteine lyase/cysteine desulfurase